MKIQIKSVFGKVIFEYEKENNTIKETLKEYIRVELEKGKSEANLSQANLSQANLSGANLSGAYLSRANLSGANLSEANLSEANLSQADLSEANLSQADLSRANLSQAYLSRANLSWADLSWADLSGANLSWANLDKRYIQIACIGSVKRMTTYCFEDDTIWCGCFKGSLKEFEAKVKQEHANNEQYLKEYMGFIKYLKSLK